MLAYYSLLVALLIAGDRVGILAGRRFARRHSEHRICTMPAWSHLSIAVLLPGVIFALLMLAAMWGFDRSGMEILADNMELVALFLMYFVGFTGGFLAATRAGG